MSLRRRFVLVLAFYGAALSALLGFVAWGVSRRALEAELDRRLTEVAASAGAVWLDPGTLLGLLPGYEDENAYTSTLARLKRMLPYVSEATVFHAAARTMIVSTMPTDTLLGQIGQPYHEMDGFAEEIAEAVATGSSTTRVFPRGGELYKYGFVRLDFEDDYGVRQPSEAVLGVLMPASHLEPVARLRSVLLWSSVGGLIVAVVLGTLLSTSIVAPLDKLSRSVTRIERGNLDRPIEGAVAGRDEVSSLARAMERMRLGIIDRDDRLRVMLAQVAHELRNPLGGIELFASAASTSEDPAERRRLIGRVRSEVSALNRIIDDFLTFARPLELEYEPVDLRRAVEEAVELGRAQLTRDGKVELGLPDVPLRARADQDQVKRAVLNLVRNAVQAGTNVRVWAEQDANEVMIAVLDDGPGISETVRDRIFDPFVSDKQAGAGLGLTIVKKVAEAHGGRVEIRPASDPAFGAGAEFRLYLRGFSEPPARPIPAPAAAAV